MYFKWRSGQLTLRQIAKITGIPRSTLHRNYRRDLEDEMLKTNGPEWLHVLIANAMPYENQLLKEYIRRNNLTVQEALTALGCTIKAYSAVQGRIDLFTFVRERLNSAPDLWP